VAICAACWVRWIFLVLDENSRLIWTGPIWISYAAHRSVICTWSQPERKIFAVDGRDCRGGRRCRGRKIKRRGRRRGWQKYVTSGTLRDSLLPLRSSPRQCVQCLDRPANCQLSTADGWISRIPFVLLRTYAGAYMHEHRPVVARECCLERCLSVRIREFVVS
jgi:hypothetical protein